MVVDYVYRAVQDPSNMLYTEALREQLMDILINSKE